MPNVGEKVSAKKIGKGGQVSYTWFLCPQCQIGRWVEVYTLKNSTTGGLCQKCYSQQRGEKSPSWKGGRVKLKSGYIIIKIQPDDFFYSMTKKWGYVLEHRLVVAKALGRNLHLWEIVHHKKGYAKDDNRYPETLQLVSDDRHKQITLLENRINYLEQRIILLEAENIALKKDIL